MKPIKSQQQLPESFIKDIRTIIERGRRQAYAAAGSVMFATNWEVGRRIVEEEQHGNARAQYGKQVIAMLANNLQDDYGSCYGQRNLAYYRQFYLAFSDLSILHTRVQNLTWSHIRRVLSVSNPEARVWYLNSAAEENWSVRTLGRNNTIKTSKMLGLPQSTELNRPMPKAQLYKKFELKQAQRDAFDADVARMEIVNVIAPQSLPGIAEGTEVKAVFVVDVELKRHDYDTKNIILIAKLIPHRIIFALRHEDKVQLAVYHTKLFTGPWQPVDSAAVVLSGLNLDAVWKNIVSSIGQFSVPQENSLNEQIKINEERDQLLRQIAALERQMNATKQPRRKRELFLELQNLKGGLL